VIYRHKKEDNAMMEYATKITALYSRLSVGDEDRDGGESNSIVNQKAFLERYARQHKLMNIRHYIDDDETGRFFDRSAYTQMISEVESGKIGIVIMKDMTRWGRDYLQVANAMEIYLEETMYALLPSTTVSTVKTKIHWNLPHLSISCQSGMQETSARK